MRNKNSGYLFTLFALFVIFSDELFSSLIAIFRIPLESGVKARFVIVIAGVAYLMMIGDIVKKRFTKQNGKQILVLMALLLLYVMTGFFYPHVAIYHQYNAAILVYGALCIPAAYIGMRLARGGYEEAMLKYLPYYIIVVAIVVGYSVISGFAEGRLLGGDDERDVGLNYQNASYYMSYCCVYSVFYVFFMGEQQRGLWGKLLYAIVMVMIFVSAAGTIVGGGRGAFVFLVLASAFLVLRIIHRGSKKGRSKYYLMLIGTIGVLSFLAYRYNLFESAGAMRVAETLTIDDGRGELTRKAMKSFTASPIFGHGLGSVWWEVGFRSHNMFQDMLVEGGIFGTTIFSIIILKMLLVLFRTSRVSNFAMFMLLLYLSHFVQDTFSGYWFSSFCIFMIFGYIYGKSSVGKRKGIYQLYSKELSAKKTDL